ncbi:MAG: hypothetical protein WAW92_01525 [Minisyncoccia bacterium]
MKVLTVIPVKKAIGRETLSYFTSEEITLGSVVKIPLRNKSGYGIVIDIRDAKELKSDIKSLSFNLKKIEKIESSVFLSEKFIDGAKKIADYFSGSLGGVLSLLVPKTILENSEQAVPHLSQTKIKPENIYNETLLLQSDEEERFGTYRSLIREEFARGHSVFFCLPTTEDILNAKVLLEKGIENYTYVLHTNLKKNEVLENWQRILNEDHPVLIIGTGTFLSIPKSDIGTIILEKESSRSYKVQTRPYIDFRTSVEIIAKSLGVRLILGDTLLRVETLWDEKEGKYSALMPLKFRTTSRASTEIILLKTPEDKTKKEFSIFGDKLKKLLQKTKENNEHTFLFCGRKGLYPTTVCSDCGRVVACNTCEAPVVLYKKKGLSGPDKNSFICHHCGDRRDAGELCKYCKSWRLNTLGIAIDRVVEEVQSLIKDPKIFVMDSDHIKNHKQAKKVRDEFYSTPGSIMIGTELALTYLNQKIENSVVVSMDSFFSIPDYQINEKVFHILLSIRSITEKEIIIQTRKESTKLFDYAVKGNLTDFWRDEIEDRKSTDYPPFAKYIKLSLEGEKNAVRKEMENAKEHLLPYKLDIYDAFNPGSQKKYTVHGLLSVPRNKPLEDNLLTKLKSLPQSFSIRVDPITLL